MGRDTNTLRWGDSSVVKWNVAGAFALLPGNFQGTHSQLVYAEWRWPLLWGLRVAIIPGILGTSQGGSETATFTVSFQLVLGVGQSTVNTTLTYAVAPTSGVYLPVNDFQSIPASHMQVGLTPPAGVAGTPAAPAGTAESLLVAVMVAPYVEPHAMTELLEHAEGSPQEPRWMPQSAQIPGAELVPGGPPNFQPPRYGR